MSDVVFVAQTAAERSEPPRHGRPSASRRAMRQDAINISDRSRRPRGGPTPKHLLLLLQMNNNDNECSIMFCISPSIRLDCYVGPLGRPRSEYSDVTVSLSVCQVYVYSIRYHRDICIRGANVYNLLKSVKKLYYIGKIRKIW